MDETVDLPHRVAGVLDDLVETQGGGDERPVVQQPGAVDAAGTAGTAVDVVELVQQPPGVADGGVGERQHVVAERRRLGLLQVGLVRHQRVHVPGGQRGGVATNPTTSSTSSRSWPRTWMRSAIRAASRRGRPACSQPATLPSRCDEEALAGVVGLTELRVVGEVLDGRLLHLEQQAQQVAGGRRGNDLAAQQVQHVGDVGQVQAVVEEGRVGVLQGEPASISSGRAPTAAGRCGWSPVS